MNKEEYFKDKLWKTGTKCLIGHNRYATMGDITPENAHPFHHGGIVGAHNGTLDYTTLLRLEEGLRFDVDSEAIFYNLANYDVKEVVGNLSGAYALVWYDQYDVKLKFIRNTERPLWYTRSTDRDAIFWASESWMLITALARASIQHGPVIPMDSNHLYELDMEVCDLRFRKVDLVKGERMLGHQKQVYSNGYDQMWEDNKPSKSNVFTHNMRSPAKNSSAVSQSSSKWDAAKMKAMENTEIEFYVDGEWEGVNKQKYLKASPAIFTEEYEIRIYNSNHKDYPLWKSVCAKYKGKVKRAVNAHGAKYLLIDCRSIEEVAETSKEESVDSSRSPLEKDFYPGYKGKQLTIEEWYKCTDGGCSWCSGSASPHDKLWFTSDNDFVCEDCATDPAVMANIIPFINAGEAA